MTTDSRVLSILHQQSQMESERSTWEGHWREIAERILPRQDDFQQSNRVGGEKRTEKIFDSTAVLALDRAASAIDSLLTPATQQWHGLEPEDPALKEDREVMLYLEKLTEILFRVRYRPMANFSSQAHESYISLMAFGTQGMYVDDFVGIGIRYKSVALAEIYIAENHVGMVDMVHRKFPMTARAAMQRWGNKLPEVIQKAVEITPLRLFDFIHCVKPNEDMQTSQRNHRGMALSSYYISCEGKTILSEGGYRTMPYLVSRHVTAPREVYGRSPAMQVLPDIKMVNEMEKTIIRAAHKIVDPPLLVHGDGILSAFSVRPNAINYGGVDANGNQLVHPLKTGSNLPIALEMTEQKRKLINDAFYVTLFQILVENPRMTATEALIRAQEKGQLLAPTVGRQQSEFLGPMIERELDILAMAAVLPKMPAALRDSGGGVKAVYTSPLTRLRRAEDGVAIMRTIEALTPISQAKPEVFNIFDEHQLGFEIADINGVPQSVLKSREQYMQEVEEKKEQEAVQADMDAAAAASAAAKNMGQAAQAASFVAPAEVPQP